MALNFRLISILPVLSKLLERHVAVSLLTWLTKHNLLFNNQSSYRPNFSWITALIKLVDDLLLDIDKGSLNGLLLVDLRKAFDLINHDLLIEKLACFHLTESSLEWFRSYLKNRKQFVKLNNHNSSELVIRSSVPQGFQRSTTFNLRTCVIHHIHERHKLESSIRSTAIMVYLCR